MFQLKCVIFSCVLVIGVQCAIEDALRSDFFSIYTHAAIQTRKLQDHHVTPEKVTYYLYTAKDPEQFIKLNEGNLNMLDNKKIVFVIHGWTNSKDIWWYESLKNAFLTTYKDYSVVQVDWKEPANQLYYVSSFNTEDVGKIIADLIVDLYKNHNVKLEDILVIGHSLGGQITGFVGKNVFKLTGRKLPRIIALDPAGPLFIERPDDKRLNRVDADVVEVIHSDGGTFGFQDATGTIDFFPNGGNSQPGCKRIDLLNIKSIVEPIPCDHHRSIEYFIEAILNPTEFVSKRCGSWKSYIHGDCENEEVRLGDLTTNATGKYYFETNRDKPFAKTNNKKGGLNNLLVKVFG